MTAEARHSGFSLIELVIVLSILAVAAGVVAPLAFQGLVAEAREATSDELESLADAAVEHFRDTGALPATLGDLITERGLAGWSGPYVTSGAPTSSGLADFEADAWGRAYRLTRGGASVLTLKSAGEDGEFGTAADLSRSIDVTPIRRATTLRKLSTLNQAITAYNAAFGSLAPLPADLEGLLSTLVARGCLPAAAPFAEDAWGDPFTPLPAGASSVVQVGSVNMGAGSPRAGVDERQDDG